MLLEILSAVGTAAALVVLVAMAMSSVLPDLWERSSFPRSRNWARHRS